jgi:hypothetical protein
VFLEHLRNVVPKWRKVEEWQTKETKTGTSQSVMFPEDPPVAIRVFGINPLSPFGLALGLCFIQVSVVMDCGEM